MFLLHGLEGSSDNLRNLQSLLSYYNKDVVFFRSEANEENTRDKIELLGMRFAEEVRNFMDAYSFYNDIEISFIGHSLGGLIVRAALPLLGDFKAYFKSFISMSSPHCGSVGSKFLIVLVLALFE